MDLKHLARIGLGSCVQSSSAVRLGLPEEAVAAADKAAPAKAKQVEKPKPAEKGKDASPKAKAADPKAKAAQPKAAPKAKADPGAPKAAAGGPKNFVQEIVERDLDKGGRCHDRVGRKGDVIRTRFPPEPNGYLHLGHAKSICLNFGLAEKFGGRCHLRFDDTNPAAEETEYVDAIKEDVQWLGFSWGDNVFFASSYFDQLYEWAELLVKNGNAYVDSQNAEDMKKNRGSVTQVGTDSAFRTRSPDENLALLREMKDGKHAQGTHILRAKVDMKSPNMNMRDPPIYRIRHMAHHRTGDKWKIYPLYDFAHGQEDAIEGITHSVCTLEFEAHRELYNWFLSKLPIKAPPQQSEFARLNLTNTVMSKRKLLKLVQEKVVDGWDDPRMSTLCGARRRGIPPEAIRSFCSKIGVTTSYSWTDVNLFEETIREHLEPNCARRMAVLQPLKVVIEDFPKDKVEETQAQNHPAKEEMGSRPIKFTREIYIEREDFNENPPDGFFRLKPDGEVKLRCSYVIKLKEIKKNKKGEITELICTHDPSTRDCMPSDRKVKGVIQWVSAKHCVSPASVNLYDYLLQSDGAEAEVPAEAEEEGDEPKDDFLKSINPNSLVAVTGAKLEACMADAKPGERFQFERNAFFVVDKYSKGDKMVINRIVGLKESSFKPDKDENAAARSRKDEQAKQAAAKEALKSVDPKDMFRSQTDLYSQFDEEGVPTHDEAGEPLPKSRVKKLKAEQVKQAKLFDKK